MMRVNFIIIILFALMFPVHYLISQDDDDNEIKMSQQEWHLKRDQYAVSAITLLSRLETLEAQIDSLKQVKEQSDKVIAGCEDALYELVGATKEQVEIYRKQFKSAELLINGKNESPADMQNAFDQIADSKIRCLPEFRDRYISLKEKMRNREQVQTKEIIVSKDTYIVSEGESLWDIAIAKYGNPLLWRAIWNANRKRVVNSGDADLNFEERISNPNMIYPGQKILLPSVNLKEKEKN